MRFMRFFMKKELAWKKISGMGPDTRKRGRIEKEKVWWHCCEHANWVKSGKGHLCLTKCDITEKTKGETNTSA